MLPEEKKTFVHRCLKEGKRKVSTPPSIVKERMPVKHARLHHVNESAHARDGGF